MRVFNRRPIIKGTTPKLGSFALSQLLGRPDFQHSSANGRLSFAAGSLFLDNAMAYLVNVYDEVSTSNDGVVPRLPRFCSI